jgi:hypothetical protein
MSKPAGRSYPITRFRRLVIDLMHFSQKVPSVTAERRMDLAAVVAARAKCNPRPCWSAIFTKAFAKVAADRPEFRRSYMSFPWPRLYEHPYNIATLNVSREVNGEQIILYAHIRRPEQHSLAGLDGIIRSYHERPVDEIGSYIRARRMSAVPWPLRRFVWWGALNIFGRRRCHNFGTFGTTTVCQQGAGVTQLIPLLTSTIFYGLFDEAGCIDMRLAIDHRVLDGATAACALVDMEKVLQQEIVHELSGLRLAAA